MLGPIKQMWKLIPDAEKCHGKADVKAHARGSDPWRSSYGGEFA